MVLKICRYILFILFFTTSISGSAQHIIGVVVDEQTGEPLSEASVRLSLEIRHDGRSWGTYNRKTDSEGVFTLDNHYQGRLEYELSYIGYHTMRKSFIVSGNESDTLRLDTLRLRPSDILKNTAVVKGHYKRFIMRGDTVIFNPKAFKLEDGARLEELIEKLDGVTIDEKGEMSWMGKPLRILVNGEDFMNGANGIVSVLPAIAVDKIKVYDKASKYTERTGNADGKEDKVLDLQIKPGWFEKWYGTAMAGYQTTDRYEGTLDAMRLSNHLPTLVFANANNRDYIKDNFIGGNMWGFLGGKGKARVGTFSIEHRNDSTVADSVKGQQTLHRREGGGVSLQHFDNISSTYSTKENFSPNQLHTFTLTDQRNYDHNFSPRVSLHFKRDFNKNMNLSIYGDVRYNYNNANSELRTSIFDDQPYNYSADPRVEPFLLDMDDSLKAHLLTHNRTYMSSEGHSGIGDLSTYFDYIFADGSNLTIRNYLKYSKSDKKNLQSYHIDYLKMNTRDYSQQKSDQDEESRTFSMQVLYKKNLSKDFSFNILYDLVYLSKTSNNNYFLSYDNGETWIDDTANSYYDKARTVENSFEAGMMLKVGGWQFMPTMSIKSVSERKSYRRGILDTTATRTLWLPSPSLNVKLRMNKVSKVEWSLSHSQSQPEQLSTLNYIDTTDPLSVKLGNPNLHNAKRWEATMQYDAIFSKSQFMLYSMLGFTSDVDPIVSVWAFNPQTGVNTTWSANAHNGQSWKAVLELDKGLGANFHTSNRLNVSHSKIYGFLANSGTTEDVTEMSTRHFTLREDYSLTYERNYLSAELYGSLNFLKAKSREAGMDNNFWDYEYGTKLRLNFGKWTFNTRLYNRGRRGYNSSDYNGDRLLWNASASWKCLKGKGKLSFELNDILNRDKNYYATVSAFERVEEGSSKLHHYCLISFTWNFDAVGGKKNPW